MITPSKTGLSAVEAQPTGTSPGLDPLDKELRKDEVNDVFGNYLEEQQSVIRDLINTCLGLTGSASPEAMDVDPAPSEITTKPPLETTTEPPSQPVADTQDQAMENEPPETSP